MTRVDSTHGAIGVAREARSGDFLERESADFSEARQFSQREWFDQIAQETRARNGHYQDLFERISLLCAAGIARCELDALGKS